MKAHRLFSVIFIVSTSLAQLGANAQPNKIQGIWLNNSFGYQMKLILNADGSGEVDGEPIRYTVTENKFTITIIEEGQTHVYNYTLRENSLTLSGGDFEEPVIFMRSASTNDQGK